MPPDALSAFSAPLREIKTQPVRRDKRDPPPILEFLIRRVSTLLFAAIVISYLP